MIREKIYFKLSLSLVFLAFITVMVNNLTSQKLFDETSFGYQSEFYGPLKLIFNVILLVFSINILVFGKKTDLSYTILLYAFFWLSMALSMILGYKKAFSLDVLIYAISAPCLVYYLRSISDLKYIISRFLVAFAYINCVALFIDPYRFLQINYDGYFNIRLFGLSNHANSLGPEMALGIILILEQRFKWRKSVILLSPMLICMILSQSKTSMLIVLLYVVITEYGKISDRMANAGNRFITPIMIIVFVSLVLILGRSYIDSMVSDILSDGSTMTLTGRVDIWRTAISYWEYDKVFGYGYLSLWDADMKNLFYSNYLWSPNYSHNLFVQIVSQGGLISLSALLIFLYSILAKSDLTGRILVILFILFRGITEVPIGAFGFTENFFLEITIIAIALLRRPYAQSRNI